MSRRDYLLAELRHASLLCRLLAADLDSIGVALRGGLIDLERAIELLPSPIVAAPFAASWERTSGTPSFPR